MSRRFEGRSYGTHNIDHSALLPPSRLNNFETFGEARP